MVKRVKQLRMVKMIEMVKLSPQLPAPGAPLLNPWHQSTPARPPAPPPSRPSVRPPARNRPVVKMAQIITMDKLSHSSERLSPLFPIRRYSLPPASLQPPDCQIHKFDLLD